MLMDSIQQTLQNKMTLILVASALAVATYIGVVMYQWRSGDLPQYTIQLEQSASAPASTIK